MRSHLHLALSLQEAGLLPETALRIAREVFGWMDVSEVPEQIQARKLENEAGHLRNKARSLILQARVVESVLFSQYGVVAQGDEFDLAVS